MNEDACGSPNPLPVNVPDSGPRTVSPEQVILIGPPDDCRPEFAGPQRHTRPPRTRRALVLFLLTCLSTFLVGFYGEPVFPHWLYVSALWDPNFGSLWSRFLNGLTYSGCIIGILGAHEMGHYLQARRYGVPASLPFFIPLPISPFGTMGAVIVQQSGVADRKSMFDIAISGPLAGLVVALPVAYLGIVRAVQLPETKFIGGLEFRDPLLLKWMLETVREPLREGYGWSNNPMLFAGWVGIFITGLNLIPIGQLDGGHILYCLIGRRAHYIARGLFFLGATAVAYNSLFGDKSLVSWALMLFLIWMFGTRHPPTANDRVELGPARIVLGWLTLMFIFIGLTPTPIAEFKVEQTKAPVERSVGGADTP